ncbi:MAG: hypothetical protein HN411_00380 [Waddliaceae bacterium]|jgi:hypothetical protein|nr:hypothetical protein [Waddliaceae bacterium]MBT3578987.1 hypothetical protein [Waddliaceae bacterium]MBT4444663.1 hypothetical protein [Waddliaceae bacterium]MBT6929184.1 hypothetical protein [Waddliaceae bacterium]MBT7265158.1 hypothetical protein [Waddliaceae bacterium]
MNKKIKIPRRNKHCYKDNETLMPGIYYHSAILWDDDEEVYHRRDYCISCWKNGAKDENIQQGWSYWKAQVPEKNNDNKKDDTTNEEQALTTIKEAQENGDEGIKEAFIAALYLERKRILAFRKEIHDNNKTSRIYEHPITEETFCIMVPGV